MWFKCGQTCQKFMQNCCKNLLTLLVYCVKIGQYELMSLILASGFYTTYNWWHTYLNKELMNGFKNTQHQTN